MFAYGSINIINKIIPFIMIPIITKLLPDSSDYGIYNIFTLVIGFGSPIAILGMYDAMFREYFERDDTQSKYDVIATSKKILYVSSFIIGFMIVLFSGSISNIFFETSDYYMVIIFSGVGVILRANMVPVNAVVRIKNQKKVLLISGLLSSMVFYVVSLIFLNKGYSYYGLIFAWIINAFIMYIFLFVKNKDSMVSGKFKFSIAKELLRLGIPLLPTFLIYWVFDSMDKIMISNILGVYYVGVYAIGAKVAQISQLVYSAFSGGWLHFVYSTMGKNDQVEYNSKIFEVLSIISLMLFLVVHPFFKHIFYILFEGSYREGYIVSGYLFLGPILLMLYQIVSSQFAIIKKNYIISSVSVCGAVFNIVLNYILISKMGIEGAAISTLSGYFINLIIIIFIALRYKIFIIKTKYVFSVLLFITSILINRIVFNYFFIGQAIVNVITIAFIVSIYNREIKSKILSKVWEGR
jgi:O-antigen/teichoic acid export membrane protein